MPHWVFYINIMDYFRNLMGNMSINVIKSPDSRDYTFCSWQAFPIHRDSFISEYFRPRGCVCPWLPLFNPHFRTEERKNSSIPFFRTYYLSIPPNTSAIDFLSSILKSKFSPFSQTTSPHNNLETSLSLLKAKHEKNRKKCIFPRMSSSLSWQSLLLHQQCLSQQISK